MKHNIYIRPCNFKGPKFTYITLFIEYHNFTFFLNLERKNIKIMKLPLGKNVQILTLKIYTNELREVFI